MLSSLWNVLTAPSMPRTALAISASHLSMIELQKRSGNLMPKRVGVERIPDGLLRVSLDEPNILNEAEFARLLSQIAEKAGFPQKLSLSVSLPEGSIRSLIANFEQEPSTSDELTQMLEWKAARAFNLKASEIRIGHRRLSNENSQPRWLVGVVHQAVLNQYERIFSELGWHAGAILPQHLGEAQWLLRNHLEPHDDQVMISVHETGFVAIFVRGSEPLMVREVICAPDEREDEVFRLFTFYRDRLNPTQPLKQVLIVGEPQEQALFSQALTSALEHQPQKLSPLSLGLSLESSAPFHHLAAASGLASLAF